MDGTRCPATGGQHDYRPDPADPDTPRIRTSTCRRCGSQLMVTNPPS